MYQQRGLKETFFNYFSLGESYPTSVCEIANTFRRPSVLIESTEWQNYKNTSRLDSFGPLGRPANLQNVQI